MTALIIIVLLVVASYAIYHFLSMERSAPRHSVKRHERSMGHLRRAAGHSQKTSNSDLFWQKKYFGLPPLYIVATAVSATVILVALIAGIILLINSFSSSNKTVQVRSPHISRPEKKQFSTQTTTTTISNISPISTSGSTATFQAPAGNYQINVQVSAPTWVEITQNYDSSNSSNVVAQTVSANNSVTANVSGHVKIILGKPDAVITVNGVALGLPSGQQITEILFN